MVSGIKIKDNRVDRLIKNSGFNPDKFRIYYSPITIIWYDFILLVLVSGIILVIYQTLISMLIYLPVYSIITYSLGAKLNNSVAVSDKLIIIVNPNFPFRKILVYYVDNIDFIEIKHSLFRFLMWPFFIFTGNNINISSKGKYERYYCTSLELNVYDENFTKLDLDDLISHLRRLGIYKI